MREHPSQIIQNAGIRRCAAFGMSASFTSSVRKVKCILAVLQGSGNSQESQFSVCYVIQHERLGVAASHVQ